LNLTCANRFIKGNPKALAEIEEPRYKAMSKELEDCIGTVGFTDEEKEQMTCIIAGILHCGDIVIPPSDMNSTVFSSGLIHSLLIGA
jgi:hypothetical protein